MSTLARMDRGSELGPESAERRQSPLCYSESAPATPLRHLIACYWQIRGDATSFAPVPHRVLPDACMDLLVNLESWRATSSARSVHFIGAMTRAQQVELSHRVDLFGVRFRPGGAAALLRIDLSEMTDRELPLAEVWAPLPDYVIEQLAHEPTLKQRVQWVERELLPRARAPARSQAQVERAVLLLDRANDVSVPRAAREIGLSTRQFERRFAAAVGLTPAQFRRVRRLRRLLTLQARAPTWPLAALAAESGYFDQSHLNREFQALVGVAPSRWLRADVAFVQDGHLSVF
jgi:AraC-like DNA-binding protein